MIIKQKKRGFICTTAHPIGCKKNIENQINFVKDNGVYEGPQNVLVIGCSTGYGLASRISLAFGAGAKTLGVSFEKEPTEKKPASAGWYNNRAFDLACEEAGIYSKTVDADAFSSATKADIVNLIKEDLGQIDMLVYSLASPKRSLDDGSSYMSAIKPIGCDFSNKSVNLATNEIIDASFEPASEDEIANTVKVMGGEDWELWVDLLKSEGLLANGFKTMAYSYLGPEVTHPIYMNGTIGQAKKHLKETSDKLSQELASIDGSSFIAINKAVVTQASSAIPVVPLYISILFKVMKDKGLHEDCIMQMHRMFKTYYDGSVIIDDQGYVRMDDWEMRNDVQEAVSQAWTTITTESLANDTDIASFHTDFDNLFGFNVPGIDYDEDVSTVL